MQVRDAPIVLLPAANHWGHGGSRQGIPLKETRLIGGVLAAIRCCGTGEGYVFPLRSAGQPLLVPPAIGACSKPGYIGHWTLGDSSCHLRRWGLRWPMAQVRRIGQQGGHLRAPPARI